MAETADMLTKPEQRLSCPTLTLGVQWPTADSEQIDTAWERLTSATEEKIIPVTYINCSAEAKSFRRKV